jgi:hypothetical protein
MECISIGWNCESAIKGVQLGIRKIKQNGYKTCPFDECITNYEGIVLCLKENFKHFCDPDYLKIIPAQFSTGGIVKNEKLLYNTRYNFIFNHESPDHANLYLTQNWKFGKEHYIQDNYKLFIKRYNTRIENFRNYLNNTNNITFLLTQFDNNLDELNNIIKTNYPNLQFNIKLFKPSVSLKLFEDHHKLMYISKN